MDLDRGTYLDRGACVEKIIKRGRGGRGCFFGKISLWKLDRETTEQRRKDWQPEATQAPRSNPTSSQWSRSQEVTF